MLLVTIVLLPLMFEICKLNAMTFKTFGKSITIKNVALARILIADENLWRIKTSPDKRNKMSMSGIISYILFVPEIFFTIYDWWNYFSTGTTIYGAVEKNYFTVTMLFYVILLAKKTTEANKFNKGNYFF